MSKKTENHRMYKIRGLATHRKMLKNGSRMKTGVGQSTVSYCPHCTEAQQKENSDKWRSHPQYMVHVSITAQKTAHCKNGHSWKVR
jgi:hypothetical protein